MFNTTKGKLHYFNLWGKISGWTVFDLFQVYSGEKELGIVVFNFKFSWRKKKHE